MVTVRVNFYEFLEPSLTFCYEKISWRLRTYWKKNQLKDGGEDSDAQEVGPAIVTTKKIINSENLTSEETNSDCELIDRAQSASEIQRSNLRYVHRHQAGVQT